MEPNISQNGMEWRSSDDYCYTLRRHGAIKWSSSANITKYFPLIHRIFFVRTNIFPTLAPTECPQPSVAIDKNPPNKIAKSPLKTQILARRIGPTQAWSREALFFSWHFSNQCGYFLCRSHNYVFGGIWCENAGVDCWWFSQPIFSQFSPELKHSLLLLLQWCVI